MTRTSNPWSAGDPGDEQVYNLLDEVEQICQKLGVYRSTVRTISVGSVDTVVSFNDGTEDRVYPTRS
jgi:hypothetical protein